MLFSNTADEKGGTIIIQIKSWSSDTMGRKLCNVSLIVAAFVLTVVTAGRPRSRTLEDYSCNPSDFHLDFTECDANGGRWRVAVPNVGCENISPTIPPKRLNDCYKSCEAGQFLNLTTLECENCEEGTYSLGGGLRFEEWEPLPAGFKVEVEKFHTFFVTMGRQHANVNCSKYGWRGRKDVLLGQGGPCVATLTYSAQLVKPGSLKFTYQYSDDSVLFQFQANSDRCERLREAEASTWPPLTGEGIWTTEEIPLRTGLNIFQWKTMGIDSHGPKPVLIKKIEIDGVGYTSSCHPCPSGTFSNKPASNSCSQCPKNTYSAHKSTICTHCRTSIEYADVGSSNCTARPACSSSDYYPVHTPCNKDNQTRITYEWVQPEICLEDHPDSARLPSPGPWKECPPCNPGTEYRDGKCQPCAPNQFSDGVTPCTVCRTDTVADTGHFLNQWYSWPENLHSTCISPENNGCNQAPAWQLSGTSVTSGKGHADWVYLVMTLTVNGFRGRGGIVNGELLEVGRLSFSFETRCLHDCELILMQGTSSKNASVIQKWIGSQGRQEFTHTIVRNDTYSFSWAFQKVTWDAVTSDGSLRDEMNESPLWTKGPSDAENFVRIYSINVTNSIDGGAKTCIPCRDGMLYSFTNGQGSCVTCKPGHYRAKIDESQVSKDELTTLPSNVTVCKPCPSGTVTVDPFATNSNSCRPCGSGLISKNGLTCTTDCLVKLGHHTFDLRPLKGFHMIRGNSLFTASGTQYYHVFNISFCMVENAQCYKNVSLQHGYENQNMKVDALICQSTVFPPAVATTLESDSYSSQGFGATFTAKPLSTHASSLGDHLIGISHAPSINGDPIIDEDLDNDLRDPMQFHFFYSTPEPTVACQDGRRTKITFKCQPPQDGWTNRGNEARNSQSRIRTPEKCPDGTCDGCNFHFIWETQYACHLCTEAELKIVRGECKDGKQEIHYLPSEFSQCLLRHNASWPTSQPCKNHLPIAIEIAVQATVGLTVILSVVLICFWRRHRNLEYKYMKLVASGGNSSSSSSHHGEDPHGCDRGMLPVAESCALDPEDADDEDDDHYGGVDPASAELVGQIKEVSFYSDSALKTLASKFSILNKLKTFARKGEMGSNLEIMNLTDKEALS